MDRSIDDSSLYFRGSIGIIGQRIAMVAELGSSDYEARMTEFLREGDSFAGLRVIEGEHFMAMPGLVNIHNHASMSIMRSYADDMQLMPWLTEKIWPFEAKLTREDIRLGAELGIAEMLLGGTTTFVDMYWQQEAVAEVVESSGIRAMLSPTFTDVKFDDFESDLKILLDRYGKGQHDRIGIMIAPHAPYSCSTEHLERARDLCRKHGLAINIHVAETLDEAIIIEERFGKTPIEYLNDIGLLTPETIAVHSVHLSSTDIDILRKSGASVAHNPQSNMKLGSGVSPVSVMLSKGINVGIGTDGPCSNNDLDMWDEMRSASFLHKLSTSDPCALPAYQVLQMGTVAGAKAIGRSDDLGMIREGMIADIVLLDIEKPHLYPRHDMVANLVYCAKSSDVDTVIVDGHIVVENRKLATIDVAKVCRTADARAGELVALVEADR